MAKQMTFPFVPKSNVYLRPGQFFSVPLSDGRFACGVVIGGPPSSGSGARSWFTAALLDWVSDHPPTAETIDDAPAAEFFFAPIGLIVESGGAVLGSASLRPEVSNPTERIRTYVVPGYAVGRANMLFVDGVPPPSAETRSLSSPLTDEMLAPMTAPRGWMQFDSLLTDADFIRLAEWFEGHPHVILRAYGSHDGSIRDLEFLRFFPDVRRFWADCLYHSLGSLDGLRHLPNEVEELLIGQTRKKLDLAPIAAMGGLRELSIEGQTKNLDVISGLKHLRELTLRSITLPDLSLLTPLDRLQALALELGGTKDLSLLGEVGNLRYFEAWQVRGLSDLTAVGRLESLRVLFLQALRQVEGLPPLTQCKELHTVVLHTMKGMSSLDAVATAPALEELVLANMTTLNPEALTPLRGHPTLKCVGLGLGSKRRNAAAQSIIGLPNLTLNRDWRDPTD